MNQPDLCRANSIQSFQAKMADYAGLQFARNIIFAKTMAFFIILLAGLQMQMYAVAASSRAE
jgi:hypothetical protein